MKIMSESSQSLISVCYTMTLILETRGHTMSPSHSLAPCELQVWLIQSLGSYPEPAFLGGVQRQGGAEKARVIKRATQSEENGVS